MRFLCKCIIPKSVIALPLTATATIRSSNQIIEASMHMGMSTQLSAFDVVYRLIIIYAYMYAIHVPEMNAMCTTGGRRFTRRAGTL